MTLTACLPSHCIGVERTSADLPAQELLYRYSLGLAPFPAGRQGFTWCFFDPPAGAFVGDFRVPRRLRKTVRRQPYRVTANTAFEDTVAHCAGAERHGGWITDGIIEAALRLHNAGHAHSIEVWQGRDLVGGLYGVAVGQVFVGESMFTLADNAGAIAATHLLSRLYHGGYSLLDTQVVSLHMQRFGMRAHDKADFMPRRWAAVSAPAGDFGPDGDDEHGPVSAFLNTITHPSSGAGASHAQI
ncbi:leucyl/phenylalanyl-tRNA--protein transferase [Rhodovibrio sodomensis]|uniref:Leucyl/phenylalanyl-tRNA--protein transferase n=1 Tax=Rhodovibrio sodomensis TaxID=1088 RepID=A0ABS1D9X5_9PROT|nr:leucyl/phenylalanyl-tRNA--protein transferase [Rhodovibrio sodomensis]MBK1667019.1 leucyl/phenylalanyl-tRNA--protein transferase [Rhodovibrio sodomensis]